MSRQGSHRQHTNYHRHDDDHHHHHHQHHDVDETSLLDMCRSCMLKEIKLLLDSDRYFDVNSGYKYQTPLLAAVEISSWPLVYMLLTHPMMNHNSQNFYWYNDSLNRKLYDGNSYTVDDDEIPNCSIFTIALLQSNVCIIHMLILANRLRIRLPTLADAYRVISSQDGNVEVNSTSKIMLLSENRTMSELVMHDDFNLLNRYQVADFLGWPLTPADDLLTTTIMIKRLMIYTYW